MRTFMEKMDPVVAVFQQKFEEIFKQLAKRGTTPALWLYYHHMVDVIKVFIRTEPLAYHNGRVSCIVTKMLHINAKGVQQLYCQSIKELEICLLTRRP